MGTPEVEFDGSIVSEPDQARCRIDQWQSNQMGDHLGAVRSLSPTENMFDIGKNLIGGKWRNKGVASGEKKGNNWSMVQRPDCGSRDEDHEWPS